MTISKSLWKALTLPTKNFTLLLPVFLLSHLSSSLLLLFNYLSFTPLLTDFATKAISIASTNPSSPEYSSLLSAIREDIRKLTAFESIFIVAAFIISSLVTIAIVHIFSVTYSGNLSTLNDLLSKIKRAWKGPMITQLYVSILQLGYSFLLVAWGVFFALVAPGSIVFTASGAILNLLAHFLGLYLTMVWLLSVVVSVVEEGCHGVEAIGKAAVIIRGRRRQGIVIISIVMVVSGAMGLAYSYVELYVIPPTMAARLATGFVYVAISVAMRMFILAWITVFYHECKEIRKEGGGGFVYKALPIAPHVDEALP